MPSASSALRASLIIEPGPHRNTCATSAGLNSVAANAFTFSPVILPSNSGALDSSLRESTCSSVKRPR